MSDCVIISQRRRWYVMYKMQDKQVFAEFKFKKIIVYCIVHRLLYDNLDTITDCALKINIDKLLDITNKQLS